MKILHTIFLLGAWLWLTMSIIMVYIRFFGLK